MPRLSFVRSVTRLPAANTRLQARLTCEVQTFSTRRVDCDRTGCTCGFTTHNGSPPYTAMPVNFKPGDGLMPHLFKGNAQAQVTGVRDALLNYDRIMEANTAAAKKSAAPQTTAPAAKPADAEE